jgi:magnesium transporter
VTSCLDAYLSVQSNRMNEVVKTLTLISTVMLPLTFIAGVYGMNFKGEKSDLNMPELEWYYGYPYALLLMAVVAIGILWFFKHKGWIWQGSSLPTTSPKKKKKRPPHESPVIKS